MKNDHDCQKGYKVKVLAQPVPTTTTPTAPNPTVATASTEMPVVRSTAMSIPVMVYKLATGQLLKSQIQLEDPRMKDILPFTPTLHNIRTYQMPQLDR